MTVVEGTNPIQLQKVKDTNSLEPLWVNNNVLYKREDMQIINSFKIRGACLKVNSLSEDEIKNGLVISSAGNHAQAMAYLSNELNINTTIVMPRNTPEIKVNSVYNFGNKNVEIILHGNTYDDAYKKALKISNSKNKTLIHPFNDEYIIAGNSTIAYEILKDYKNINKIFVPIGGGGCISGIAVGIKNINPKIKVIGVESINAAGMYESIKQNKVVTLDKIDTFVDGCAVKRVGYLTYNICKEFVDEIITVENDEIYNAINIAYNDTRVLLEPAGALSIAGIYKYTKENKISNENIIAILSGANYDISKINKLIKFKKNYRSSE
jgi:threonine dehydratase